jgi:DNA-binding MarR family transcriptional regulator
MLNELSAQQLLERSSTRGNRRRNIGTLTDAGTARLAELDHLLDRAVGLGTPR